MVICGNSIVLPKMSTDKKPRQHDKHTDQIKIPKKYFVLIFDVNQRTNSLISLISIPPVHTASKRDLSSYLSPFRSIDNYAFYCEKNTVQ